MRTNGARDNRSTYYSWRNMRNRCYAPSATKYESYGGRGITVCQRWRYSFPNFLSDMGPKPEGMTLGRINNDEGYSLRNCRWETPQQQSLNKRNSRLVTFRGETRPLLDWAKEADLPYELLRRRIVDEGWAVDLAMTTPRMRNYQRFLEANEKAA